MTQETPLSQRIKKHIHVSGPLPLDQYMAMCLSDPSDGYYMTQNPFGTVGDFITAPEISQMFGEIIGLWAIDMWMKMGCPSPTTLIEIGPGRGTLMADILRASRIAPEFMESVQIHLVETSPYLREIQMRTLATSDRVIEHHRSIANVPDGPSILIANEFFDALPVCQFEWVENRWKERCVDLDDAKFTIVLQEPEHLPGDMPKTRPQPGDILEWSQARQSECARIAQRCAQPGGAALIIDYGHKESMFGDTLQAVSNHAPASIFDQPGRCDLTSHVDFQALGEIARTHGALPYGPLEMGTFLLELGIGVRAQALKKNLDKEVALHIDTALHRLTDPSEMGDLFKVLALTGPHLGTPAPFPHDKWPA